MDPVLFERVRTFIAREVRRPVERITPSTLLEDDLGVTGDDAEDLMRDFAAVFGVDLADFAFARHFGEERAATPWSLARGLAVWLVTGQRGVPSAEPVTVAQLVASAAAGRWVRIAPPVT